MASLSDQGFLDLGDMRLEYRMIGPQPDAAPTLIVLREGLRLVGMWGDFPDKLQAATDYSIFVYSRVGYGRSTQAKLPRKLSFMCAKRRAISCRISSMPSDFSEASWSVAATVRPLQRSTAAACRTIALPDWC